MQAEASTDMNLKTALLDVSQMAQADRLSVAAGISGVQLMHNAGRAVAHEILQRWSPRAVTVLCGPGNNGGDGFVVALQLLDAGWPVRLALLGERKDLAGEAAYHAAHWHGPVERVSHAALQGAELLVDALFGAGLTRPLHGPAFETLAAAAEKQIPIVAIDVPSGLMGNTGEVMGAVPAVLTVTFFRKKPGHLLLPGRVLCGELVVADIGTPTSVWTQVVPDTFENDPALWRTYLTEPLPGGNKYTRGHALVYGAYPMTGAARMAARAAARMGAGLTTIVVPEEALPVYAAALTSIMVQPMAGLPDLLRLLLDKRFTALLIGPGAGASENTLKAALAMLATGRATLLDADAITVFERDPALLDRAIVGPCVITPHEGEFDRVFDATGDKLTRARAAARRSGAVVVLKGADTVIAAPDGRAVINTNAPATLATAGAGDVLGGMVLGLLAQGMAPFPAASAAVWLHGAAATAFGPGLMAEDLPDALPAVLRSLFQ
ncbi:MAG: NAD(P)H-hydrate dehydratase [Polaromonas sp.]|nr:NAD(P)H-hydrate dehydratase [Polaromonas sp.]